MVSAGLPLTLLVPACRDESAGRGVLSCTLGRLAFPDDSDMDLVSELAGSDPMARIKNRFGTYWIRQYQRRLLATFQGVVADNIANDGGDMGVDASTANIDGDVILDAAATMGNSDGAMSMQVILCCLHRG